MNILNKQCLDQATIAYEEIDWRKFRRLDIILLIPTVILGSLFVTSAAEVTIFSSIVIYSRYYNADNIYILTLLVSAIVRSISSFFLTRQILKFTQGSIINSYGIPSVFRSFGLSFFSFFIVGIPSSIILAILFTGLGFIKNIGLYQVALIMFLLDIGRMFLLIWVVWRHYIKHKDTGRRHFLFKRQTQHTKSKRLLYLRIIIPVAVIAIVGTSIFAYEQQVLQQNALVDAALNSGNYTKALALDPRNTVALTLKGSILDTLGNHTQATTYLDKAIAVDAKNTYAISKKGDILDNT